MNDIIVSISTALGKGAISIVRLSGDGSISLVNKYFKGNDLNNVPSHTINYGYIIYNGEIIDEVMVSIMRAPKTYTREDVVEINCHGGIASTNKILEIMVLSGARLAKRGEFTERAYLNGRIDLAQAEAVMDVINSETDVSRKVSIGQLNGRLSSTIKDFRNNIVSLLANIEVNIDYPEYEDAEIITVNSIREKISYMKEKLEYIVKLSQDKKIIKNGINVSIVGRPNVGKSSILNKIIGEDKAIVTDVAGTTRDIVEGRVIINGIAFNFVDTAGIRETDDIVEKFGVNRSLEQIEKSDLVLLVLNNNEMVNLEEKEIIKKIKEKKYIVVVNKKDLDRKINIDEFNFENIVYTDTLSIDGINSLKEKLIEMFNLEQISQDDSVFFTNTRQITLAREALLIIEDVINGVNNNVPVDLIEIDIKRIWDKLGEILGENYSDELIDKLFSDFCLGK